MIIDNVHIYAVNSSSLKKSISVL